MYRPDEAKSAVLAGRENPAPPRVAPLLKPFLSFNAEQDSDNKNKKQETKRKIKKENNNPNKPINHPSVLRQQNCSRVEAERENH